MASGISQTYVESKTQFRGVEGDGEEEEDGEEMLDPRVKVITYGCLFKKHEYNSLQI